MVRREGENFVEDLGKALRGTYRRAEENLDWLRDNLNPYFFITMQEETEALVNLAAGVHLLTGDRRLIMADESKKLIIAGLTEPGSFHKSLRDYGDRGISYAEITHSFQPFPGQALRLTVQRYEFDRKQDLERQGDRAELGGEMVAAVREAMRHCYPHYDFTDFEDSLRLLTRNNRRYVTLSPPDRTARILWLYQQGQKHNGLFLDVSEAEDSLRRREARLVFAVGSPPEGHFFSQVMEVFHRLDVGFQRAYCLMIHDGRTPWFLGAFYIEARESRILDKESGLTSTLRTELYNTQILSTTSRFYVRFVASGRMAGEEASFANALVAFCHTSLAHRQPDRFHLSEVIGAFSSNLALVHQFSRLFQQRFDPEEERSDEEHGRMMKSLEAAVRGYNTGHRHLDEVRRAVYRTALIFIRHTLKTNFFVPEKHSLAFRLDPAYLKEMGEEFTADLPPGEPFRITFFSGRHGMGYHVGFADIARGGWRTNVSTDEDDYNENAETLFREAFVLAHTQHLKNKDIYEGGSKMVVIVDASDIEAASHRTERLHKLQFGFINAFFDIFAMEDGRLCHPRVVDYFGGEEAIELGPDENMHDSMIELIARQAVRRRYLLGRGVISSKKAGIGHKEYGVTSLGVVTFAEIAMREIGIDMGRDEFSFKTTGGPNGDVAGNTLRLLLERCPRVRIKLVIDGSGVLYDPVGIDRRELRRLILKKDIDGFRPEKIHDGGFLLTRKWRREGIKVTFRRSDRLGDKVTERWVTADELNRTYEEALFDVPADLFIPAGGRPETVHEHNCQRLFDDEGRATVRVVVEGANSFISPAARDIMQKRGVVIIRDASANKCGVISSSYEIIANLLMSEEEFLAHKEDYIADVLTLLERRARDEAEILFRRWNDSGRSVHLTEISDAVSREMNGWYAKLFDYLLGRPELLAARHFRRALLSHLPAFVVKHPRFRRRTARLPLKYRCAMVASEIAAGIVYRGGWGEDFERTLDGYVRKTFPG